MPHVKLEGCTCSYNFTCGICLSIGHEPSAQDKHFAEKAIELARQAAMAAEEADQYARDIDNRILRRDTLNELERIL